jgi:hypothetical protein
MDRNACSIKEGFAEFSIKPGQNLIEDRPPEYFLIKGKGTHIPPIAGIPVILVQMLSLKPIFKKVHCLFPQ